ncbi:MAG: magnesium/cobalt transporter CorA [Phycisphaerae bacterium]|nr:magnesium/cobalt transporter CorA [Phycisphaerae bacterium]
MPKKRKKGRLFTATAKKAGLPPGTPVYVGDRAGEPIRITRMTYDEISCDEHVLKKIEDGFDRESPSSITWINIDGVHDVQTVEKVGARLGLHPLTLEDIVHPGQRPKFEEYENYLFIVLRMLRYGVDAASVTSEQVSFILCGNTLITFQELVGDVFEPVRQRIRAGKGRARKMGADYLAYALMDAAVDQYFTILETIGEKIETLEEQVLATPDASILSSIHYMKRELMLLRKSVWPLRELLGGIQRTESGLITPATRIFVRDVYDHTIQIMDIVESFRDVVSGMLDIYLSSVSNRMNATMKVLTVIATIFIPLSFITGIFGMNFEYFPELKWAWAYPWGFWGIIVAMVLGMLYVFKRNKFF